MLLSKAIKIYKTCESIMDVKERNRLIAVTSLIIGLVILMYIIPYLIVQPHYYRFFSDPYFYMFIGLLFLAIALFFYSYFMLRPVKTLKGRKYLAIGVISFGGVLIAFPLIGISFVLFGLLYVLSEGFLPLLLMGLIPLLVVLIPGVLLFMHGWYMRKNLRSETNS